MYLSCSALTCDKKRLPTVEETIEAVAGLGFHAIDLDVMQGWQHIDPSALVEDGPAIAESTKRALDANGLFPSSLNANPGVPWDDDSQEAAHTRAQRLDAVFDFAAVVGSPVVTIQPPNHQETNTSEEERRGRLIDVMTTYGSKARSMGLCLTVEGHADTILERPDACLALFRDLGLPVGLTYDPSHFALQGIPLVDTEPLISLATHVHVRHSSLENMQDLRSQSTIDMGWVVQALRRNAYDGAVAIEYFGDFDPDFTEVMALRDMLLDLGVQAGPSRTAR